MDNKEKLLLQKTAHTVRALSADAIEKQKSGHPGLPLGAAEIGTYIYTKAMRHNPSNPSWIGRDRFVLSAGHGSMLQYALLHLTGYDLSLDDIKDFRLLKSKTPGHPEYGTTSGVESTTGPLGQGVAAGTGMAIAQKLLGARFGEKLFDSKIFVLAGDGCLMEGISSEAGSLAGTLKLNNLIIVYDSNDICLDGPTSECFTKETAKRYEAYNFNVIEIDGYDFDQMGNAFKNARAEKERPTLIIAKTIIGRHTPGREGTSDNHGKYLDDKMEGFKKSFDWPLTPFHVPKEVYNYFEEKQSLFQSYENEWNSLFEASILSDHLKNEEWDNYYYKKLPSNFEEIISNMDIGTNLPTRKYNETIIRKIAELVPYLISGSADVSSVDFTWLERNPIVTPHNWNKQQIKFGVREFSMAGSAYGMNLHGMLQPVVGTFLVFSDYMRNAIRMTAMMNQKVIFIFSHDSVQIGQDGPTHQPVEHLMSLRLIPNLTVLRPGDENEAKAAWISAMKLKGGPVVICFTRQPVKSLANTQTTIFAREGMKKGAYYLYGSQEGEVDIELFVSGSEINIAVMAAKMFKVIKKTVRVISVPSWELFDRQADEYKSKILNSKAKLKVSIEAGVGSGWQKFVGNDGLIISQETYGESAPEPVMAEHFGYTPEHIFKKINQHIGLR